MQTRQRYTAAGREYTISPEPHLAQGRLAQVLVRALLRDETTGNPPLFSVRVSSTLRGSIPRAVEGGLAGLAGIPGLIFPDLPVSAYPFEIAFEGERSVPFTASRTLGPQPGFPGAFLPDDLGTVELHRDPVVVSGRAARQVGAVLVGIPGVTVQLTGLWRQTPAGNVAPAADPPNLLSLAPGVHLERTIATGRVRAIALNPVLGDTRALLEDYNAGDSQVQVSNRTGLGAGAIIEVNPGDPGLTEFVVAQSVAGSADPTLPATITLQYPGRRTHRLGTVARRVTAGAPGPDNNLTANLIPGDRGLVAAALAGLAGAVAVEIHGGAPSEYQLLSLFDITSDAAGYFRLPPLCRAGQIELRAENGVVPPIVETVVPDYSRGYQTVNFIWS